MTIDEKDKIIEHATNHLKAGIANLPQIAKHLGIDFTADEMHNMVFEFMKQPGIIADGWIVKVDPKFNSEIHALTERKLRIDVKNAERIYASYPRTMFLAWLGAFAGVIAILLKVAELLGWLRSK